MTKSARGLAVLMIGLGGTAFFGRTFVGRHVEGLVDLEPWSMNGHNFLDTVLAQLAVLRLQAGSVATFASLLAAIPYLLSIVVAQLRTRWHSALPADLNSDFRTG